MKILHILSTPRAEGTPNLVLDWLATGEHLQEVFVLNSQPAELAEKLRTTARWYGQADLFHGRGVRKFLRIVQTVRWVCRERQPDLVICWPTGFSNWVCAGARLALRSRVRLLVHSGNPPTRSFKGDCMSRFVLLPVFALGGLCICCSNYVRDEFRGVPGLPDAMFTTVYNCARIQEVLERAARARSEHGPASPSSAIMVATMERHKDHETLLRAVPVVLNRHPSFRLRLAGHGSLASELQKLTAELGIGHAVEFLGSRRDVPELLGQSGFFVFSTTAQEGLGTVLIEALAAGLPVIASDCPACREVLVGGKFGSLVRAKDPAELANEMSRMIERELRKPERSLVEYLAEFTPQKMMQQYVSAAGLRSSAK